jgi:hypothetical protein
MKTIILIFQKYIKILNLIFDSENCYFNCLNIIWISNFWFEYDIWILM